MLVPNKPVKWWINGCEYMEVIYLNQLPVGLFAQLVEHYTGIAEVMGSNSVQAWIWRSLSFTFSQCSRNAVDDFYKFWNQILLKMLAYIFWSFSKSRNLNSDLYPRKSTGSNEKDFRAYLKPNFSNTFYEHSEQHIISRRSSHLFFVVFFLLFCLFFLIWLDKLKLGRSLNNI